MNIINTSQLQQLQLQSLVNSTTSVFGGVGNSVIVNQNENQFNNQITSKQQSMGHSKMKIDIIN